MTKVLHGEEMMELFEKSLCGSKITHFLFSTQPNLLFLYFLIIFITAESVFFLLKKFESVTCLSVSYADYYSSYRYQEDNKYCFLERLHDLLSRQWPSKYFENARFQSLNMNSSIKNYARRYFPSFVEAEHHSALECRTVSSCW